MLPDSFLAMDGLVETFLTILNQFECFPAVIDRENQHYFPFLATTTLLMEAVKQGAGREEAHEAIKEHAVATVLDLRSGSVQQNDLARRLAEDGRLGLTEETIEAVIRNAGALTGRARGQIKAYCAAAGDWAARFPESAAYQPGTIL
jgi:adenylosuccinate lyase